MDAVLIHDEKSLSVKEYRKSQSYIGNKGLFWESVQNVATSQCPGKG